MLRWLNSIERNSSCYVGLFGTQKSTYKKISRDEHGEGFTQFDPLYFLEEKIDTCDLFRR